MKRLLITSFVLMVLNAQAQDTLKTISKLTAATVYYGYGAELTHDASFAGKPGVKQVLIQQLSTSIDVNSIEINLPSSAVLLSYQYSLSAPAAVWVKSTLSKKRSDSITFINTETRRINNQIYIEEQTLEKTGKLIETVISTSGNKTITSEAALTLINAYTAKIEKGRTIIFNLKENIDLLTTQLSLLQQRIDAEPDSGKRSKPYGQLLVQVMCSSTEEVPVSLSYFTHNAGWTPFYDLRVNARTNSIKLIYKASVTQTTGIDWKQVMLTLSTGNPATGGTAPELTPHYLQLYVPAIYYGMKDDSDGKISGVSTDKEALNEVVISGYGQTRKKEAGYSVTTVDPVTLQNHLTLSESQLNTNFEINLPYNIESDGQLHAVNIKEETIHAILKNYAAPVIDDNTYLMAAVSDWQNLNLLPGTANIIMDNTYLGKSFIDPNSTADTLNLSLGKDRRVISKRTAVKDFTVTKTNGNNTTKIFTYEITLKNNKLTDVDIDVNDQFPLSTVKDIEVKLIDAGTATVNNENGFLNWQIKLKPGESKKVRFSYSIKFPKGRSIANL